MNNTILNLRPYPMEELNRIKEELKKKGVHIYDFGTGDPKEPVDEKIVKSIKDSITEISQYPSVIGRKDLRESIANWVKKRFEVELDPDGEIIPSNGSKEAIFHLPLTFINTDEPEKSRVIFGTPAYPVYERGTLYAGGKPYPVKLREEDKFLLRLDKVEKSILEETKIVWINYPHNPTGATADISYLKEIYSITQEFDIILCSDECYTEIYFDFKPPSALQVGYKNLLIFHSLSKRSGLTGYRTGFIAGDKTLIDQLKKSRSSFGVATPDFIQAAAKTAWSDENHVEKRREVFRKKRDLFIKFFNKVGLEYLHPEATFYFWIKTPKGLTTEEYVKQLLKYGIVVSPGVNFCAGIEILNQQCQSDYFRIALVPSYEECLKAVKVWEKAHSEIVR